MHEMLCRPGIPPYSFELCRIIPVKETSFVKFCVGTWTAGHERGLDRNASNERGEFHIQMSNKNSVERATTWKLDGQRTDANGILYLHTPFRAVQDHDMMQHAISKVQKFVTIFCSMSSILSTFVAIQMRIDFRR